MHRTTGRLQQRQRGNQLSPGAQPAWQVHQYGHHLGAGAGVRVTVQHPERHVTAWGPAVVA